MAKRLLPPDWRMLKDDGSGPVTDGTLTIRIAGTATATPAYSDKELSTSLGSSISCDAYGYPASGGNEVALWGSDSITYDIVAQGTGYNGGSSRTLEDVAVADTTTSATSSTTQFTNLLPNGGFNSWGSTTSWSNLSGDNDGDETAPGWFFAQPTAASNEVSRQSGSTVGSDPAFARYGLRFGRPAGSTSTNKMRAWSMCVTDEAIRARGQVLTLSFTAKKGADFSGSTIEVKLATGTSADEDGDLIESAGFSGNVSLISQSVTPTTSAARFEITTIATGSTIQEIGVQFGFTPSGTAGSNDWVQIEDVQIELASSASNFESAPENLEFVRKKLTQAGRDLLDDASASAMRTTLAAAGTGVANTFTANQTIESTDAGATSGPDLILYRNSASPANADYIGGIDLRGKDNAGNVQSYASLHAQIADVASGSEDGTLLFHAYVAGVETLHLTLGNGQAILEAGTAAAPSLKVGDEQSGLYKHGTGQLGVAVAGVFVCYASPSVGLVMNTGYMITNPGSASSPGFQLLGDATRGGFYRIGANSFGGAANGALVWQWDTAGIKDASGNILQAAGKQAVPVPASAMVSRTTSGAAVGSTETATNKIMLRTLDFDQSTDEFAQFIIPAMPKRWNESTITFRAIWTATTTGDVIWAMQAVAISDDDPVDAAFGTAVTVTDSVTAANDLMKSAESSAITIGGTPAEGDMVVFQIYRDADAGGDTIAADAKLIGVEMFFTYNAGNDA